MIIGTAGHIDHGKTALVRALTGVDTDRLPEEKRRGITIELGFAPLHLDGVGTVGVVDVPGHEAFVRTMLAGATGIDLALLVIAADEGAMPQTREHLAILGLLGVRGGVIALTKSDLVDADWISLVQDDVRTLVAGSPLADAEIVSVSAMRGDGLAELRLALQRAVANVPQRAADDLFRMPVDRAFTVRGTGTVVTGTVWSGRLRRDESVRLMPAQRSARVRSLQRHGGQVEEVGPGERAAVSLVGVDVAEVARGSVIVAGPAWQPTTIIRAEAALLDDVDSPLEARTRVRFHLGTSDIGARVVAPEGPLFPGVRCPVRILLESPVVARAGDRFVLRSPSPAVTIGGGIVEDPLPAHRRTRPAGLPANVADHAERLLAEGGAHGIEVDLLPLKLGITPGASQRLLADLDGRVVRIGSRAYPASAAERLRRGLRSLVDDHHASHPLEPGAPLQAIRGRLAAQAELVDSVVSAAIASGELALEGGLVRRAGWQPVLTASQAAAQAGVAEAIRGAGREPPSVGELEARFGGGVSSLLRLLERRRELVLVEADRYFDRVVLERLIDDLRGRMEPGREYGPGEMREIIGVSRKYLIPLLEYCDRSGVTERRIGGRALAGT
jgi:selenocysteine-specific elongation factor